MTILLRRCYRPQKGTLSHVGSLCGLASYLLQIPLGGEGEDAAWFGRAMRARAGKPEQEPFSLFRNSGIAVLRAGEASVIFCAMANGLRGKGSHTHCDKLSIIFRLGPMKFSAIAEAAATPVRRSCETSIAPPGRTIPLWLMSAEQNIAPTDPGLLFQCGNEAAVSPIALSEGGEMAGAGIASGLFAGWRGAPEDGATGERSLLILDELSGTEKHLLDLRFILGPGWRVSSEMMTGETVSCVIAGPRRLSLRCEAESPLALSYPTGADLAGIWRCITSQLYPDPNHGVPAC